MPNGPIQFISQLTGRQPGIWPSSMAGPALGAVGKTALGAGLGYAAGIPLSLMIPRADPKKTRRSTMIAGALAGAGLGGFDMYISGKAPEGSDQAWPYKSAAAAESAAPATAQAPTPPTPPKPASTPAAKPIATTRRYGYTNTVDPNLPAGAYGSPQFPDLKIPYSRPATTNPKLQQASVGDMQSTYSTLAASSGTPAAWNAWYGFGSDQRPGMRMQLARNMRQQLVANGKLPFINPNTNEAQTPTGGVVRDAINRRMQGDVRLFGRFDGQLEGSNATFRDGSTPPQIYLGVGNDLDSPHGDWQAATGPGPLLVHEMEHTLQPRNNRLPPDYNPHAASLSAELPAVLSEVSHAGAAHEAGGNDVDSLNVNFAPNDLVSLGQLMRDARRVGHLGGNVAASKALATPAGQLWLRNRLKHYEKSQPTTRPSGELLHSVKQGVALRLHKSAAAGWVGLPMPPEVAAKARELAAQVKDEDLAEDGRETHPHLTALYGLKDRSPERVRQLLYGHGPVRMTFGQITAFRRPEYDVLKVDVGGRDVRRLNKLLKSLPHKSTFRYYAPHMTLAYLKPGTASKYMTGRFPIGEAQADKAQFNYDHSEYQDIPLDSVTRHKDEAEEGVTKAAFISGLVSSSLSMPKPKGTSIDLSGIPKSPAASPVSASMSARASAGSPTEKSAFFGAPQQQISVSTAANTLLADPNMGLSEKAVAFEVLSNASSGRQHGVITDQDLVRGAIGAGLGYAEGRLLGKAMGAVFGLPAPTQRTLASIGMVGGILRSTGVLK